MESLIIFSMNLDLGIKSRILSICKRILLSNEIATVFRFVFNVFIKSKKSYICNIIYHAMDNSRLSITDTQENILWAFLENRDTTIVKDKLPKDTEKLENFDKFEQMIRGLTSYGLEKNKIPRRTWDINKEYMVGYNLISLIREEKKGKQLRRHYDITSVGRFTLAQKLDIDTLEKNFIKKFSVFVPEIARHWTELEKTWGDKIYFILKQSLLQINWFQWRKEIRIVKQKRDENQIKKSYKHALHRFEQLPDNKKEKYSDILHVLKNKQDKRGHKLQSFLDSSRAQINQYQSEPLEFGLIFDLMTLSDELNKPNDRIENPLGTQIVEKTVIPFESNQMEITLFRKYTDFANTRSKQVRKETTDKGASIKIVIPTSVNQINFDTRNNDIMNRLVFVFYYNLVRYCKEGEAAISLANWIWNYKKFKTRSEKELKKEIRKDPVMAMNKRNIEKYDIAKEITKASKKTITIIQKDAELQKMMNTGIKEIKSKFAIPETVSELSDEINR